MKQDGIELTPAYDIVPCALNIKPLELALHCGKQGRTATIENILSNTASFGLSTEHAEAINGYAAYYGPLERALSSIRRELKRLSHAYNTI